MGCVFVLILLFMCIVMCCDECEKFEWMIVMVNFFDGFIGLGGDDVYFEFYGEVNCYGVVVNLVCD